MNLQGKWKGYYQYGANYQLPQFGERVNITAFITGNNENFVGTIEEEPSEHSVPLKGKIKGFSEGDFISFLKTYPKFPRLKEFGSSEVVMEDGKLEIEHEGFIDTEHKAIYGKWYIVDIYEVNGETIENISDGIWLLKKVS